MTFIYNVNPTFLRMNIDTDDWIVLLLISVSLFHLTNIAFPIPLYGVSGVNLFLLFVEFHFLLFLAIVVHRFPITDVNISISHFFNLIQYALFQILWWKCELWNEELPWWNIYNIFRSESFQLWKEHISLIRSGWW